MLFLLFRLLALLERHWTKNFWMFSIRKKPKQVQTKRKLVSCYSRKIPITGFKFVMLRTYCNTVALVLVRGLVTLDTKDMTVTDQAFTFCWDDCSDLLLSDLHRTSEKERKKQCMCTMRSWEMIHASYVVFPCSTVFFVQRGYSLQVFWSYNLK